jgi:DNA (cytosine-5)-methyltransferase 1
MIGEVDLFLQQFKPFSGRWPISGMMRDGVVYELPMQEHHTTDSECSSSPTQVLGTPTTATSGRSAEFRKGSNPNPVEFVEDLIADGLLPTPNTMEHREIKTAEQIEELKLRSPGGYRNLREVVINEMPDRLLPTPAVGHIRNNDEPIIDYLDRRQKRVDGLYRGMPGASLGVAVRMEMLMTPVASEGLKAPAQQTSEVKSKTGQVWLSNQAKDMETNWGKFTQAIKRWESITRPAPAPTKPDGKDGNHRLSAEFTEWMMGLPAGWVTAEDIGLKRNDALKACGNGVVPQQAELALKILLQDVNI